VATPRLARRPALRQDDASETDHEERQTVQEEEAVMATCARL
jgi:hypothetical protein